MGCTLGPASKTKRLAGTASFIDKPQNNGGKVNRALAFGQFSTTLLSYKVPLILKAHRLWLNDGTFMEVTALTHQGVLEIKGRDAIKFFQGYCTCNLETLTPEESLLGAITNIQGRVETTFIAALDPDGKLSASPSNSLLISMQRDMVKPVIDLLRQYIVFSKATLVDRSEDIRCYGVSAGTPVDGPLIIRIGQRPERLELWTTQAMEAGPPTDQWQMSDIEAGLIWVNQAQRGRFQPFELNLSVNGAVDFQKGCYLGQEIIARVHYRGNPKKVLVCLDAKGDCRPGEKVYSIDKRVCGEIVASASTNHGVICAAVIESALLDAPSAQDFKSDGAELLTLRAGAAQ